jgi:hypothetical protein
MLRCFFANFCHEIGCEYDQTYIFRFVRYLSTFFHTYLPINIHFQLIIITIVSDNNKTRLLRRPSCFSDNLVLEVTWFSENNSNKQVHVFGLFTLYWNVQWKSPSEKEINKKTFIYSDYLLKNICQEDPNSHFLLKLPKTSSVKRNQTEHVYLGFRVIFGKSRDLRTRLPKK